MAELIRDVACLFCGCLCDDLQLSVADGRIVAAEGACSKAEPLFLSAHAENPPAAVVDGAPASLDDALTQAAQILGQAGAPLVCGLSRSGTAGQRAAVALAEKIGAVIDPGGSHAIVRALQRVGESTCTLGEVKNRADLVIFWHCDPVESHPRHWERYSVLPASMFRPRGRADRTVVVVDDQRTATADAADQFVPIEHGRSFHALWALRALVRGVPCAEGDAGVAISVLAELAERMKSCRYGVIVFDAGSLAWRGSSHGLEALLQLVTDLNDHTRFCALPLGAPGNGAGAENVLAWQTGYPCAVNFARGYPRFDANEYSAEQLLERGEVDACLTIGGDTMEHFSRQAQDALTRMPTIVLADALTDPPPVATVSIRTATLGIDAADTVYRVDGVAVPARAVLTSPFPADAEVLNKIAACLTA